jgi:hypothetical protein
MFTMDRHLSDEALAALQLACSQGFVDQTWNKGEVDRFKRSSEMTKPRNGEYIKIRVPRLDKSGNSPD